MAFEGFPSDLFDFLKQLTFYNEKAWFEENRARYEDHVKAPLQAFITEMAPRLAAISPHFVADPRRSMFRIHRDVRFSKDKSPYKTNAAAQFRHSAGADVHAPGYYLHLEPGRVMFGGGVYKPPASALAKIRAAIDQKPDDWRAALAAPDVQKAFGGLGDGDPLTRAPKGYPADHPLVEDLKKRSFFVMQPSTEAAAQKPAFLDDVARGYAVAAPVMRFLTEAVEAPF